MPKSAEYGASITPLLWIEYPLLLLLLLLRLLLMMMMMTMMTMVTAG